LSRITEPTTGRVELYGRVGSLLEVGTGFHPELTGRENIYLSGAVLGMGKREIQRKFDAIVDFSGVGQFIDTPVKRCSSGMYLRLAFAVAAHLDPEILLIDEVLAVGDGAFQKKCLGKMEEVAGQGRTVFFVSHHMPSIKALCSRAIWIHEGKTIRDGDATEVVTDYLKQSAEGMSAERFWQVPQERPGNAHFRLLALRVLNPKGEVTGTYSSSEPLTVEMQFDLDALYTGLVVGFDLVNRDGIVVFRTAHNDRHQRQWPEVRPGRNRLQCIIPAGLLNAGTYWISPKVGLHSVTWFLNGEAEVCFDVVVDHSESPFWNIEPRFKLNGVIAPCLPWQQAEGNGHTSAAHVLRT
jgi:lipopolysaccharide transport system ATP-binding protein